MKTLKITALGQVIVLVFSAVSCSGQEEPSKKESAMEKKILKSQLAGSWYPASKKELEKQVSGFLEDAEKKVRGKVCGLILPHAGYMFSGAVAAEGISQLGKQKFKRVVVIGPSHRVSLADKVSVPDVTHYATPLGEVPLDTGFIKKLKSGSMVVSKPLVHEGEHSVQIEVPLLQQALGDFCLVPIVTGTLSRKTVLKLAGLLLELADDDTLVVASSDFTHYGSRFGYVPFDKEVEKNIRALDMEAFDIIKKKDLESWYGFLEKKQATICGRYPIAILMAMAGKDNRIEMVKYDTSGKITGDFENSVSYIAAAVTGRFQKKKEQKVKLGEETRKKLLEIARNTIGYYFKHGKKPSADNLGVKPAGEMKEIMGAFVTLKFKKTGALRGCIGQYPDKSSICDMVIEMAIASAFNDPRFAPLAETELEKVSIEISALYPPRPVASYEDIELGKHGIIISKAGRRAVYLPQVAPEQGWNLQETLSHLSRKAGLPADAWKQGAEFRVFEAEVFGEEADE